MDLHILIVLFPAGVYFCFSELRDEQVFVIIYAAVASYFAGVMVRLMLTLTPVVCVSAAIALSNLFERYLDPVEPEPRKSDQSSESKASDADGATATADGSKTKKANKKSGGNDPNIEEAFTWIADRLTANARKDKKRGVFGVDTRVLVIGNALFMLLSFVMHCTWVTSSAYSSPSVVLSSVNQDGSKHIIDDYREAYYWLRENTREDAVVMSWWDYGYQIAGMADRPTLVDNNTWNNSAFNTLNFIMRMSVVLTLVSLAHIATVGKAMSSSEEKAYPILRKHDVEYVLIIFGGLIGYSGDDINKFLWMVRIAQGVWPEEIQEPQYFTPRGEYKVDAQASDAMKNSLMYKMTYHRCVVRLVVCFPID
jgi:dolichyl-diphosphooligosaccharide--protein glycosyltransferase